MVLSYLTQMLGLTVQNFVSAATGICVGCELYLFVARRRGVVLAGGPTDAATA